MQQPPNASFILYDHSKKIITERYKWGRSRGMIDDNVNCRDNNIFSLNRWDDKEAVRSLWRDIKLQDVVCGKKSEPHISMKGIFIMIIELLRQTPVEPMDNYRKSMPYIRIRPASVMSSRRKLSDDEEITPRYRRDSNTIQRENIELSTNSFIVQRSTKVKENEVFATPWKRIRKHYKRDCSENDKYTILNQFKPDYRKIMENQREKIRELMRKTIITKLFINQTRVQCEESTKYFLYNI